MKQIVFIGGFGRSGSTLLETRLSQSGTFFPVGELKYIWSRGLINNELCGCGQKFKECDFWNPEISDAFGGLSESDVLRIEGIRNDVEKNRHLILREWVGVRDQSYLELYDEYKRILTDLYNSIFKLSGFNRLIDNSKDVAHGLLINRLDQYSTKNIQLVRDSRAVAFSFNNPKIRPEVHWKKEFMKKRSCFSSSFYWIMLNYQMEWLAKQFPTKRVRYEDLVSGNNEAFEEVKKFLKGYEADEIKPSGQNITHTISGNPLRFDRENEVVKDERWINEMSLFDKKLVAFLNYPLLKKYGYL